MSSPPRPSVWVVPSDGEKALSYARKQAHTAPSRFSTPVRNGTPTCTPAVCSFLWVGMIRVIRASRARLSIHLWLWIRVRVLALHLVVPPETVTIPSGRKVRMQLLFWRSRVFRWRTVRVRWRVALRRDAVGIRWHLLLGRAVGV